MKIIIPKARTYKIIIESIIDNFDEQCNMKIFVPGIIVTM